MRAWPRRVHGRGTRARLGGDMKGTVRSARHTRMLWVEHGPTFAKFTPDLGKFGPNLVGAHVIMVEIAEHGPSLAERNMKLAQIWSSSSKNDRFRPKSGRIRHGNSGEVGASLTQFGPLVWSTLSHWAMFRQCVFGRIPTDAHCASIDSVCIKPLPSLSARTCAARGSCNAAPPVSNLGGTQSPPPSPSINAAAERICARRNS